MSDLYCRSESDSSGGYLHMFSCDRGVLLDSRNNANQVCLLVSYFLKSMHSSQNLEVFPIIGRSRFRFIFSPGLVCEQK